LKINLPGAFWGRGFSIIAVDPLLLEGVGAQLWELSSAFKGGVGTSGEINSDISSSTFSFAAKPNSNVNDLRNF